MGIRDDKVTPSAVLYRAGGGGFGQRFLLRPEKTGKPGHGFARPHEGQKPQGFNPQAYGKDTLAFATLRDVHQIGKPLALVFPYPARLNIAVYGVKLFFYLRFVIIAGKLVSLFA